ncbi:hypothetical protein BV22DRAFT_1021565, partial [Leucogyrophana mollusca]
SPTGFLKGAVGKRVVVRLSSGVDDPSKWLFRSCGDQKRALTQVEHANGSVANRYGGASVRENNGACCVLLTLSHCILL